METKSVLYQLMGIRMNGVMNDIPNSDGEYQEIVRKSDLSRFPSNASAEKSPYQYEGTHQSSPGLHNCERSAFVFGNRDFCSCSTMMRPICQYACTIAKLTALYAQFAQPDSNIIDIHHKI